MAINYKAPKVQKSSFSDLVNLIDTFSNIGLRQKADTTSALNGLNSLIGASMTDEQITNAEMAVVNLDKKASQFGETDLHHQSLEFAVQNKRNAYTSDTTRKT